MALVAKIIVGRHSARRLTSVRSQFRELCNSFNMLHSVALRGNVDQVTILAWPVKEFWNFEKASLVFR